MKKTNWNDNWQFSRNYIEKKPVWENITLPHTWNAIDGQDGGNDYARDIYHYRKSFLHEQTYQRTFLEFEGIYQIAEVFLNGKKLKRNTNGYATFRVDLTDHLLCGINTLIVSVDNRHEESIYPLDADFTFYGGIYRDVHLITVADISYQLSTDQHNGVLFFQDDVTSNRALCHADVYLENYNDIKDITLSLTLTEKEGAQVFSTQKHLRIDNYLKYTVDIKIDKPHLWQGTIDPYLYQLKVEIIYQIQVVDSIIIPIGFRRIEVKKDGFYLNGIKTKLHGVSRHQDRENVGNALTRAMHDEDFELIHEIGANAVRLSHYQQAQYVYDLCDKLGFLVWSEIPYITRASKTDHEGLHAKSQLETLIMQSFNHPSIVMWGVQNEITSYGKEIYVEETVKALHDIAKELDTTRPTVQANLSRQHIIDSIHDITDLDAYNLYFGWYEGQVEDLDSWLKNFHKSKPNHILAISEYGVGSSIHIHSETPKMQDFSEEYQAIWHEKAYGIIESHDFLWGSFIWNMFEFASDFRAGGGTKGKNMKGIVTFDRKVRKDSFYYYQSKWSRKPVLHITSKRFVGRYQKQIIVKVYSNLDNIKLYHNNKIKKMIRNDVIFRATIELTEGENHILVQSGHNIDKTVWIYVNKDTSTEINNSVQEKITDWIDQ